MIGELEADTDARMQVYVDNIAASFGNEIRDQRWSTETANSLRTDSEYREWRAPRSWRQRC